MNMVDTVPQESTDLTFDHDINQQLSHLHLHRPPPTWPVSRKIRVICMPTIIGILTSYAAGAYAFAGDQLTIAWGISSFAFNVGTTMYIVGLCFPPVVLAVISEVYGRYWVFVGGGLVFGIGMLGSAVSTSFGVMLATRFICGSGASIFPALTAGVISDCFDKRDRNWPMTLFAACTIFGSGIGPLFSGFISDHLSWRWIFHIQCILIAVAVAVMAISFEETRANVLLEQNCHMINAELERDRNIPEQSNKNSSSTTLQCGRMRFTVTSRKKKSLVAIVLGNILFPLKLLATESIVFWFSAWATFAWAILYMQFSSILFTFKGVFGFSNSEAGLVYLAVTLAGVVGVAGSVWQDCFLRKHSISCDSNPEARLYFACVTGLLLPIGLFMFAFTARAELPWILPAIAIFLFVIGIFFIYLTVFNYLADAYGQFSSSAQAAHSMCRNSVGAVFPLIAPVMFDRLGYGAAGSVLGGIGVFMSAVPLVLCFLGPAIRARSAFARSLAYLERASH